MRKTSKTSAAERAVDMFAPAPIMAGPVEPEEATEHGERASMEDDADRMREKAFTVQDWTTSLFGSPDAPANEYRMSLRGCHYYLETLAKTPGTKEAYGYTGLMVHERDLYNMATVIVAAVRAKQAQEGKK